MTVRLRIFSGTHKGAELDLTPGDWSVGSDALCDILLSDVAPQQATLRVDDDGSVFLLPGPYSEDEPAQGQALPHFAPVHWGAVCVAVGPCDAAWPAVDVSPVAFPSTSSDELAPAQATAQEGEDSPLTLAAPTAEKNAPQSREQVQDSGQGGKQAQVFERHGGIFGYAGRKAAWFSPARLVLMLLLLALTAGGVWQWATPDTPQQRRENIEAVLRAEGLRPSVFEVEENMGAWTVVGVVTDNKKLQDVIAALRGLGMVLHLDILSRQSVAEALEARIQAEGARLSVTQRGDTLRLTGYTYDAKSLHTLLQPLEADCQRAQVRQEVIFWKELRPQLKDSLAALKLQDRVRLTPGPYTIAVDATALAPKQQEALRSLEREVVDMARGISPLTRPVSATMASTSHKPQVAALKATLCDQIRVKAASGTQGAAQGGLLLVLFEGREYASGAHLSNGMQVQEVRPEYVTLVQGERLVYCPSR